MTVDTTRIVQVAIVVRDLDAKVKAWSTLLGREPSKILTTGPVEETRVEYRGVRTPGRLRVAVFSLGECDLELMEPIDGPSVWQEYLDERGDCIHHIGFLADEMDESVASLEQLGLPLVQRAVYRNDYESGSYSYFRSEPQLGAMIELNVLN